MIDFTKLGAIHEEKPEGYTLGQIQAPVEIPERFNCNETGPLLTLPILMQGFSPECGGYSLATLINVLSQDRSKVLSGSFAYAYEKTVDGVPSVEGTLISAVGKAGSRAGTCLNTLFPDDGATKTGSPQTLFSVASQAAVSDAATRELGTPFLLDDLSIAGIQQAVFQNGAVILEVQVGSEWYTDINGKTSWAASDLLPIRPPKEVIDTHFICICGYDQINDRLWFPNSWSAEWAQNGWGYLQSNYAKCIMNGIAFKQISKSVQQALTTNQISLAQQILADMKEMLALIQKEI